MEKWFNTVMEKGREKLRQFYLDQELSQPDANGNIEVDVSFDGSWMTRGRKSHIGVGIVMDVYTGIVIDLEVLCNHCPWCKAGGRRAASGHVCHKNFDGNSGAMEGEAAVRIWSRSLELKMKYTTFVGDGDSSAHKAVCQLNNGKGPYEEPVIKEECINHVRKRMGARLRNIMTRTGKMRSLLGGAHSLTDEVIDLLGSYYGKAIRDNVGTNFETMRDAVWATFFHLTSTDENPAHQLCPPGANSWCFFNRALAEDITPASHDTKALYLAKIPREKLELIKSIYRDLTAPGILRRCLRGQHKIRVKVCTRRFG